MKTYILSFTCFICLVTACKGQVEKETNYTTISLKEDSSATSMQQVISKTPSPHTSVPIDRKEILNKLQAKIDQNKPLIVHVFVPLSDNNHQGIVPTSPSLGNGFNTRTNLYWATRKGMKRYFKERPDWKMLNEKIEVSPYILERVVFEKQFEKGPRVLMIADAYRGDQMKLCLEDYFGALAGKKNDRVMLADSQWVEIAAQADLLIFNGHNGLMDVEVSPIKNSQQPQKDAVAIACISEAYFRPYWEASCSYPLVMTTGLMYPGAFVTEHIVNTWAQLNDAETIRKSAGEAYYKHKPKSGKNGSNNLFSTGW